ncbi:hypothetical protein [Pseudogemmobacter sonorensis]|uniref:hypothetical protein n=1 Tax=Pseudogemmobacter sonorensis TaxID=2989681 RepID=UPI0036AF0EB9
MENHRDPPIEELPYRSGVTVIDIGDVRVSRGMSRRPYSGCKHLRLIYDSRERRIWCKDCERDIEGFDAFQILAERSHEFKAALDYREKQIAEAEAFTLRSRAAKNLDHIWRSRTQAPCCPHCRKGLLPEDMLSMSSVGVEYERKRRARIAGGE